MASPKSGNGEETATAGGTSVRAPVKTAPVLREIPAASPSSIHFFERAGLDYVSASPYRVPVARLAAAQAALHVKVGD